MRFYLGAHRYNWACDGETSQALFISDRTLRRRKTPFRRAVTRYAIDSGGFTELSQNGGWTVGVREYADRCRRYARELGMPDFIAQQDWMCEDTPECSMLSKTGLTVEAHQALSTANYLALRDMAPELPWAPTLQGWGIADYWRHMEEYARRGVDLSALPVVCAGSVCRRANPIKAACILQGIAAEGIRVHAFGIKAEVLALCASSLASSDSMAWSTHMRRERNHAMRRGLPYEHFDPNSLRCAERWVRDTITSAIHRDAATAAAA